MTSAIIVAAGKGTRMGGDKLLLTVAGQPLIAHTWRRFDQITGVDEIILVVRAGLEGAFRALAKEHHFQKPFRVVAGGPERQDSVWNGLEALRPECDVVAIQDGARPCTSAALIQATIDAARETGAAVVAQRVTDTIKESEDSRLVSRHLDRGRLWAVQTPQTFQVSVIRRALAAVRERQLLVTDDTAACELIGQPVRLVEGAEPNPKLTSPADLRLIEWLLRRQERD